MPKLTPSKHPLHNKRAFQNALTKWFEQQGKTYPWRQTHDPWAILISEIMLQQTQITTVLGKGYYTRFMSRYPTAEDMAQATEQEILKAWEGLGYYRRARNLHAAALAITRNHHGVFPTDFEKIRALPGIGAYTAGAVASFAYNQAQPIVDANVARVFARLFDYRKRIDTTAGNKQLWSWAHQLIDSKNPRAYNSALMELGQTHCSNKSPDCNNCPVKIFCHCTDPTKLPIKKPATKATRTDEFALFSRDNHGRILLEKQQQGKRREGMWHLPRRQHEETLDLPLAHKTTYTITRYHVTLRIYACPEHLAIPSQQETTRQAQWHPTPDLENLPMPSPDRRALESLLEIT